MTATTQISRGVSVQGTFQAGEDVSLLGRLAGRVESDALLVVEEGAWLEAETHVRQLVVHGTVVGDVYAVERVEVSATGQVKGAIRTAQLKLVPGGRIAGRVETGVEVARKRFGAGSVAPATPVRSAAAGFGVRPAGPPEPAPEPARARWGAGIGEFLEPVRTPEVVEASPGGDGT
jgi:cytoskeletal protein CcmA (bactofilin family)